MNHNHRNGDIPSNTHHGKTNAFHTITIPESVRESNIVPPELMAEALTHLHHSGILVLSNAISKTHLANLSDILLPEAAQLATDPSHHFNFGAQTRNMDQAPPLDPSLMYTDVWANPIALAILRNILGPDLVCHYANGNTALPHPQATEATGRQPVHSDIDVAHPLFPFSYAINIPLCDVDATNGATEIWPGSHTASNIAQHCNDDEGGLTIQPDLIEARRQHSPPVRACTQKGSLIIRDLRLWHAGMPNLSTEPRIMLAFVVAAKWYMSPAKVLMPARARAVVEAWKRETGLEVAAEWVEGEVDHRKVKSEGVDFGSANAKLKGLEANGLMHL
ncbi:hypothetical protein Q7P37_000085 [Cladosporium fusiforme]